MRVQVIDQCPECAAGHIDLSEAAFARLAPLSAGLINVSYTLLADPALPGPVSVAVKQGSSQYWLALLIDNTGNPLASVQVQTSSGWLSLARASYNYWIASSGAGQGPFTVRLTDTQGHQVTVSGITLNPGAVQSTGTWMYGAGARPAPATSAPAAFAAGRHLGGDRERERHFRFAGRARRGGHAFRVTGCRPGQRGALPGRALLSWRSCRRLPPRPGPRADPCRRNGRGNAQPCPRSVSEGFLPGRDGTAWSPKCYLSRWRSRCSVRARTPRRGPPDAAGSQASGAPRQPAWPSVTGVRRDRPAADRPAGPSADQRLLGCGHDRQRHPRDHHRLGSARRGRSAPRDRPR